MSNIMIKLEVGSPVIDLASKRKGLILDCTLTPNGVNSPGLVAVLVVEFEDGGKMSATSEKFGAVPEIIYSEFYPTIHMLNTNTL